MAFSYKSIIALLMVATAVQASPLSLDEDFDSEGRIFTTSNGGFSLTNTTVDPGSLLALLLLGILFYVTVGQNFFGASAGGSGYGYQQRNAYDNAYDSSQFYQRSDQYAGSPDEDVIALMAKLDEYDVNELQCKMYVACEASQIDKHDTLGDLAREVDYRLRHIRQYTNIRNPEIQMLVNIFNEGDLHYKSKKGGDICAPLLDNCKKEMATKQ